MAKKDNIGEQWQCFSQETSMHGVKFITDKAIPKYRRIIWTALIAVCIMYCIAGISLFMIDYTNRAVSTTMKIQSASNLTFPTVTICNRNYWKTNPSEASYEGSELIDEILSDLYSGGPLPPPDDRYNWSHPALQHAKSLKEDIAEILSNLSHSMDDTFEQCRVGLNQRVCSEILKVVHTDGGHCFRYNSEGDQVSHSVGASGGVAFLMDAQTDYYSTGPNSYAEGFFVAIHDSKDVPLIDELSYAISPGMETTFIVRKQKIEREPPPADFGQADCFDAEKKPNPLHYYQVYSESACIQECFISFVIRRCGCRDMFHPALNDTQICDLREMLYCSTPALREFPTDPENNLKPCNCKARCNEVRYSARLSAIRTGSKQYIKDKKLNASAVEYLRQNIAVLKIVFAEMTYDLLQEKVTYSGWDLLANFGGTLGVSFGGSILTLIEFIEFGVRQITYLLVRRSVRNREKTTPVTKFSIK